MKKASLITAFLLITALSLQLLAPAVTVNAAAAGGFMKGDVNADGNTDTLDFIALRLYLLGLRELSAEAKSAADTDSSGNVNTLDYILLRLHLLGIQLIKEPNAVAERMDSLYGSTDRALSSENVLLGASYVMSAPASERYPDEQGELTDGKNVYNYTDDGYFGIYCADKLTITFDIGKVTDKLTDFSITSFRQSTSGIGLYDSMKLSVSDDGVSYSYVTTVYAATDAVNGVYVYRAALSGSVTGRYVRCEFSGRQSAWNFFCEAEFIRYSADATKGYYGSYYSAPVSPKYWNPSLPGYNDRTNLLRGLKTQILPKTDISETYATDYYNTPEGSLLTDGAFASKASFRDTSFFHYTSSGGRYFMYDLGAISAVTSFSGEFLSQPDCGVYLPTVISVYVSENGTDFGLAGRQSFNCETTATRTLSVDFGKAYRARYVVIYTQVTTHVWCSELMLYGTKSVPGTAVSATPCDYLHEREAVGSEPGNVNAYATPDKFDGIGNVLLPYHCLRTSSGGKDEAGLITVNEYLPYVGYYDKSGTLKDTFFDGFLYLPYTGYNYSDFAKTAEGWNFYVNEQFTDNRNVDALNTAVGQTAEKLGKQDYKAAVYFSILYPFKTLSGNTVNTFGDLDGDGISEEVQTLAGRKKVVRWMIDTQISLFRSGSYGNLSLKGFYWFEESVSESDKALILYASEYLHAHGLKLFWIPWYRAAGYSEWESYGFDVACMQPNYAFNDDVPLSRLYDNADATKSLGMCVEWESGGTDYKHILKIKQYMKAGIETGFMEAIKMYYQSGVPGDIYNCYASKDAYVRSAYDEIYLYAKGRLTVDDIYTVPDELTTVSEVTQSGGSYTGEFETPGLDCGYVVTSLPRYGTLRLNRDGTFVYTPFEGFAGADTFTVCADYGYGTGAPVKVVVTVKK